MPSYRTILRRSRQQNITGPAVVSAIGEGLKGLASGLNAKHQRNMDVQQADLAKQKAEQDAANDAKMQEWRDKQAAMEEAKLNAELGKSGVERTQRRETVTRLEQYLTANEDNLTEKEIRAARIVLKTGGTALSPDKLTQEFYKAIFDAQKPDPSSKPKSDSETRLEANEIIELEQKQIERMVKPIESRMKADIARIEKKRDTEVKAVKTVFNEDDEPDVAATQKVKDNLEAKYAQEILDLQERYDAQINALWEPFSQRSAPGGFEALQDTVKANIPRQPTGISRLDETRGILDEPLEETGIDENRPAGPATPMEDTIGTALTKGKPATKSPSPFDAESQPTPQSEAGAIDDNTLLNMSGEEAANLPEDQFQRWMKLKRARKSYGSGA